MGWQGIWCGKAVGFRCAGTLHTTTGCSITLAHVSPAAAFNAISPAAAAATQVVDDILDFTQTAEQLGKPQGQDLASGNLTAPVIYALQQSKELEEIIQSRSIGIPICVLVRGRQDRAVVCAVGGLRRSGFVCWRSRKKQEHNGV